MKKNHLCIVNKFRFMCSFVIILLLLYCGINSIFKMNIAEGAYKVKCVEIHIKYGDTIWGLAKKFSPEDKDIRKTLYEISIINNLDSFDIYPGQVIKIPLN